MLSILMAALMFFSPDTLTKPCDCRINERFKPREVNKDTLQHFWENDQYKAGVFYTLSYLNADSTDHELYYYLGEFSFKFGEQLVNNETLRKKSYKDNPHVKYNVIQDSVGYIVRRARQEYGPKHWTPRIKGNLGHYTLCSYGCRLQKEPKNVDLTTKYFHLLIAMERYQQALELIKTKPLYEAFPTEKEAADFYMGFNRFYIAYGDYRKGLKYSKYILNNYEIKPSIQQKWNDIYHHAIRTEKDIPEHKKPYVHVDVQKHIPEIDD